MKEYHNRPDYSITLYEMNQETGEETPHILKSKILTPDITAQLDKISTDENMTFTQKVVDQMVIIFGNDSKFYQKFDAMVMNQVLVDIVQEVVLKKNT